MLKIWPQRLPQDTSALLLVTQKVLTSTKPVAKHGWQCSSLALFVCVRWREERRRTFLPKHILCYLVFILVTV